MIDDLTDAELAEALETCAAEPVHIPGIVQPFACLIAADPDTGRIDFASANTDAIIGIGARDLLGRELPDALGAEVWHGLRNVASQADFTTRPIVAGIFDIGGRACELRAFRSDGHYVIEIEPDSPADLGGGDKLAALSLLLVRIQSCGTQAQLFDLTVDLLRHMSGYDRVTVYRFDAEHNGEILAEAKRASMDPFLGLRFPSYDIPAQARAIMAVLPLRLIADVDQEPVPLHARDTRAAPLDIALATTRGVSKIHMQYLRNAQVAATMTLTIKVEDRLWGIISFHSRKPRVPPPALREVLTNFLPIFNTKLHSLIQAENLQMVMKIDALKDQMIGSINTQDDVSRLIQQISPTVLEVLDAVGLAVLSGSRSSEVGEVPGQAVLDRLLEVSAAAEDAPLVIEDLAARMPDLGPALNGCAGALVAAVDAQRVLCVFRPEIAQSVTWAGNPTKTIERRSGHLHLQPRGSFSAYLEEVSGRCRAWSDRDIYFVRKVLPVIDTAERRVVLKAMQDQQSLMIDELNHRVRNILALVRSVSRQTRESHGSLESYSAALEARIQALATAHDLTSSSFGSAASIQEIIRQELEPYLSSDLSQVDLDGKRGFLRADMAPIFSLVIHELATNAAKYGALSDPQGQLSVNLTAIAEGIEMQWSETGGPKVRPPVRKGFGSALIEKAVAHELGGTSSLRFEAHGVQVRLFLPSACLVPEPVRPIGHNSRRALSRDPAEPLGAADTAGYVLLVEDNYLIAAGMTDQLKAMGFAKIEAVSNAAEALELLGEDPPVVALLDVNLGSGRTSIPVALQLREMGVPFMFVTGYGESAQLPPALLSVPILVKPVPDSDLEAGLHRLLGG